ncbi:response regulator [Deinococcus petrolearius]|uniref:Response regulator n=1 Tax=Deinococcus petrolearius TaxID=1751295 RepID=A0ABW1DGU0_9DEIO
MADPPPLRLLVVDDEAQILELLDLSLSLQGFDVRTALSGPQALALASEQPFDTVVMDVLMSPWDGLETARRLHARLGAAAPPVVLLTGLSLPDHDPAADPLIAAALTKPFRPSELVAVIWQVQARQLDRRPHLTPSSPGS